MDNLLDIFLEGPFALLSSDDTLSAELAKDADRPGLFLWSFEVKQAHRLHYIGSSGDSVAAANAALLADYLDGRHAVFDKDRLFDGEIELLFTPDADQSFSENATRELLRNVQVFFCCPELPARNLEEIRDALVQRYLDFGQTASKWLDPSLCNESRIAAADRNLTGRTVRFHRPAFIASLPDDMYL